MPFLFLLLLTLTCLQQSWPKPLFESIYPLLDAVIGAALTWGLMFPLLAPAGLRVRAARRQMAADPGQRSAAMRRLGRFRRQHLIALVIVQVTALYALGWGWIARGLWPLPGVQIALLLPIITGLFLSWVCFYDL